MNKFLSPAFAAALTLVATVGFAQPRSAYSGHTPMTFGSGSVGTTAASSQSAAATISRTSMRSPVGQAHMVNKATSNLNTNDRRYTQALYVVTAVVAPLTGDLRGTKERVLRTGAATKSAAMSRIRQVINDIGVPVQVISINIVRH